LDNQSLANLNSKSVNLSFNIVDGIMNVKPFDLDLGSFVMNLSGWTSFDREIGYTMKTAIPKEMLGPGANNMINDLYEKAIQAGINVKESDNINLTTLIGGTLDNPKLNLDLAQSGKEMIEDFKKQGEEILEQKKEEARQKAKEEAARIIAEGDRLANEVMNEARSKADNIMSAANKLAEDTREQAEIQARKLEDEGKDKGILGATAAKAAADQLRKEGDKQAENIIQKARKESDDLMKAAKEQAAKIRKDAADRAAKL
jgi:cell division septum initiation protein DivIVA